MLTAPPTKDLALEAVLNRVEAYLERERLRGWDPYDALLSPVFQLPVLRSSRPIRFGAQQIVKRSPLNLRPVLRINKHLNPVSLGLYIQGQAERALADPSSRETRMASVRREVSRLRQCASAGFSGICWGYPFDWETRYGSIPAGTPTVVATGMITNALYSAWEVFELAELRELILSASEFVRHDLNRTAGSEGFCFSYSPLDHQAVLNATLKGSRLLAQAHTLGAPATLLEDAADSVSFVLDNQRDSGAWPYSVGDARTWADNFHTGYVLECLSAYRRHTGQARVDAALDRGWTYYRQNFFTAELIPKYYDNQADPLDATAAAQAILTLCEFGDIPAASGVAEKTLGLLGRGDGSFAYQLRGHRLVRTPFLRWSTAWMYCALSGLSRHYQS